MARARLWTFQLAWNNPYTEPPNGQPRVLAEITRECITPHPCPEEIDHLHVPGSGYVVSVGCPHEPRRRLSEEAKGRIRRRNLERRILRKAPLFASDLIARELSTNAKYFYPERNER